MDEAGPLEIEGHMEQDSLITQRHQEAIARGDSFYRDPQSGLWVMTALALARRGTCCGSGCRHCPYPLDPQDLPFALGGS